MGTVHAKESNMTENARQFTKNESTKDSQNRSKFDSTAHSNRKHQPRRQANEKPKTSDFEAMKVRVDKIHVDGLKRTKDDIVKAQVMELFKAKNFFDVLISVTKVQRKLKDLECFNNIGIYIDASQGPDATPDGIEVTFNVKEMKRLRGAISGNVGSNEGSVLVKAISPNLFGRGESLQVEFSQNFKKVNNISVSAVKPIVNDWMHTVLTASIFNTLNDFPWSGYSQNDKSLLLDLAINSNADSMLKHNLQYEATYRTITACKQASFQVREYCGKNLKSALRHICSIDKRDSPVFPTRGNLVQFSTEVAGLGGDIGFVKNELILQSNWTPLEYATFQLGCQAGLLRSISDEMKISIADQFFLGGPINLRGFEMRSVGPRADGNALGGDVYWAVALHLYTPLPFRPARNGFGDLFRLHGFINGGNISKFNFKRGSDHTEKLKIFTENVRCAAGGGLAMKFSNIRIELNVTMPLLFVKTDILRQFQFGIGMQYL